jgi:hypothetical protein
MEAAFAPPDHRRVSATSARRSTFPTIVFGSSVRNSMCAGTL